MLKLAYRYMRYYKNQTLAILMSILFTAALLSGVSSLLYSSQMNKLENSKRMYGNWHYYVKSDDNLSNIVVSGDGKDDYCLKKVGNVEIKDVVTEPYLIYFMWVNDAYRQMANCDLEEGAYPRKQNEIAADRYTLNNLGFYGKTGDILKLNGKKYVVRGIIQRAWTSSSDEMNIFVGKQFQGRGSQKLLYLQFDENEKLYKQLDAFLRQYKINSDEVTANSEIVGYLGGEKPDSILDIIKFAVTNKDGNFTYIILKLQEEYNLSLHGMIMLLCLFSLFVVYSIFTISVSKRTSEYGMMQTLGISDGRIGGVLVLELWMLFLTGYPIGCLLGNGVLKGVYHNLQGVFSTGVTTSNIEVSGVEQLSTSGKGDAVFYVAWSAIVAGGVCLFVAMALIGILTVQRMKKQSVRQLMNGDTSYTAKRKIYSLKRHNLVPVVVRKFMFSNKKKMIGILVSLSIGGCIFLCTTYMTENLKIHAEMTMKADDGLGSEYRVSVKSQELVDGIPDSVVETIKKISGLSEIYATKYTLGELAVQKRELEWTEYFDEPNKDEYFQQKFGGICVKKDDGSYGIKYDVYGYDAGMLRELQQYILEGEIVPGDLEQGDKIIVVANQDGQGNYNFYGKHPGDTVTLKVPREQNCSSEILRFQSPAKNYMEKKFKIAAIVNRALAQESGYLNEGLWSNMQSVILTNRQMKRLFGIENYSFVNASPAETSDADKISSQILKAIRNVPKAVLQDYTRAIETQRQYLRQQQIFFSGIAVILLIISLFHIMNSMNYSILSRRREYGIMRAMGITDSGFYKMVLRTGLWYGILADGMIILLYNLVLRRIMDYYMVHVVQFLHITATVPGKIVIGIMLLNLLIAVFAVLLPARKIVNESIISEITGERASFCNKPV